MQHHMIGPMGKCATSGAGRLDWCALAWCPPVAAGIVAVLIFWLHSLDHKLQQRPAQPAQRAQVVQPRGQAREQQQPDLQRAPCSSGPVAVAGSAAVGPVPWRAATA